MATQIYGIQAPAGTPQRIVTPWMEAHGYGLETPMETMVAGAEISPQQAAQIDLVAFNGIAPKGVTTPLATQMAMTTEAAPDWWEQVPGQVGEVSAIPLSNGLAVIPVEAGEAYGHETVVNGVPVGGPGVPEPPKWMIAKEWNVKVDSKEYGTFRMYYFRLTDGRCMSYHSPTMTWKIWRPKKHIVISKDPRVSNLRKLGRLNKRVEKMLRRFQPKKTGFPARALARRYLSTAERKLLKGGV